MSKFLLDEEVTEVEETGEVEVCRTSIIAYFPAVIRG